MVLQICRHQQETQSIRRSTGLQRTRAQLHLDQQIVEDVPIGDPDRLAPKRKKIMHVRITSQAWASHAAQLAKLIEFANVGTNKFKD